MFTRLWCRFFGHRFTETEGGIRLRCLACDYQRSGHTEGTS